jgi:flagellar M-ring protein FliF
MEPLLKQLRSLPKKATELPPVARWIGIIALVAIAAALWLAVSASQAEHMQYAFTNLSPEDSSEAAAQLKNAGIPFRLEANGAALAVPAEKVYDARLLLAGAGLPRGGGAGFELFDRGDLGVSEFTQKINLRRALEGELARTIGHLANVRSARVHLSLEEKGLYRDDERHASGAVVLNLQPGRTLGEREISGIRHLIASSVSGLAPEAVTIVDGKGTVLSSESTWAESEAYAQREMEKSLESRVVSLLEPAVGAGAVVARVSAVLDQSEQTTSKETVDPSGVVRSEHKVSQTANQGNANNVGVGGLAGAVSNTPAVTGNNVANGGSADSKGASQNSQDESRTFDVGRTVTHTSVKGVRLTKLSVAILVDGVNGQPRSDAELQQLGDLARRAVGFDEARGDQLEISSASFARSTEVEPAAVVSKFPLPGPPWAWIAGGGFLLLLVVFFAVRGRGGSAPAARGQRQLIKPGERVAALEAVLAAGGDVSGVAGAPGTASLPPGQPATAALGNGPPDASINIRDRARALVEADPARAALLLRAWISSDEVANNV